HPLPAQQRDAPGDYCQRCGSPSPTRGPSLTSVCPCPCLLCSPRRLVDASRRPSSRGFEELTFVGTAAQALEPPATMQYNRAMSSATVELQTKTFFQRQ